MNLQKAFETKPTKTTASIGIAYLAFIFAALFLIMAFCSCKATAARQEGNGCYAKKSMIGFGPGGYKRSHMSKRSSF